MKPQSANTPLLRQWIRPLLIGLCVGVVTGTLLLLGTALLLQAVQLPTGFVPPLALAAAGVGAFAAGLTAALLTGQRGLLIGALCGVLVYLLLLLSGLIRSGGVDAEYALIKWAVLTVCGALGGVLGVNRRR